MRNKYYGLKKIKGTKWTGDSVVMEFTDHTFETISKKMFDVTVTDNASDATKMRELRVHPVAREVLQLLLDWDIKISEVEYLTTLVVESINKNIEEATKGLWDVTNVEERTMQQVDKVMKKYGPKTNK